MLSEYIKYSKFNTAGRLSWGNPISQEKCIHGLAVFIFWRLIMAGVKGRSGIYVRTESIRKSHTKHRLCEVEGCNNKHWAKGLCRKHWSKQYYQDNRECCVKWTKQWQKDNKKYRAEYQKQYKKDNKEIICKRSRKWRENHKKLCAKWVKRWGQTLNGKISLHVSRCNRRALTKDLTKETIQRVYEDNIKKYGVLTCYLCGKPIVFGDKRLKDSLDHSTPLTRQGTNDYENLGVAHLNCNMKKHTMTLKEYNNLTKQEG